MTRASTYYNALIDMVIQSSAPAVSNEHSFKGSERVLIRERHHSLAKTIAQNGSPDKSWASSTVAILLADPAFKNLVSFYQKEGAA